MIITYWTVVAYLSIDFLLLDQILIRSINRVVPAGCNQYHFHAGVSLRLKQHRNGSI